MNLKDRIKRLEALRGKDRILLVVLRVDGTVKTEGQLYSDVAAFCAEDRFRWRDIRVIGECCCYPGHYQPEGAPATSYVAVEGIPDDFYVCKVPPFIEEMQRRWQVQ